jgi:hypothetical protein
MPQDERWELRTRTFGCNCSTTSFLVSLITVFSTIAALILLYLLVKAVKWLRVAWRGRGAGWELHVEDDGKRWGHIWIRKTEGFWGTVKRMFTGEKTVREEDEVDPERAPLLGQQGI